MSSGKQQFNQIWRSRLNERSHTIKQSRMNVCAGEFNMQDCGLNDCYTGLYNIAALCPFRGMGYVFLSQRFRKTGKWGYSIFVRAENLSRKRWLEMIYTLIVQLSNSYRNSFFGCIETCTWFKGRGVVIVIWVTFHDLCWLNKKLKCKLSSIVAAANLANL